MMLSYRISRILALGTGTLKVFVVEYMVREIGARLVVDRIVSWV